jgi:serine/threonine-protein kinase
VPGDTGVTPGTDAHADTGPSKTTCAGFNVVGGIFQASEPWNTAVDQDPVSSSSTTIINWLSSNGGWGNGNKLQIDFSINILCADATTPLMPFTLAGGSCSPDCDNVTTFPVPAGGAVEGETGYACNGGGDCHLLVVDRATQKLWEMYQGFDPPSATTFNTQTGAYIWDLTKAYPPNLRGDGCTSADAGGFPIAAMLFTADEVAAGHIDHAIRFILPNARIEGGSVYVHPASHTTQTPGGASGATSAPPYGVHFRLKSTFDVTQLPMGVQVVAKAMQKYGMFLADGGNIALTAANDQFTTAKWTDADVNVGSQDLFPLQVTDFEVVDLGALVTTGDNCIRNP